MKIQQKEKGFTIIEVVLVLAIAGLIFLMVFIALPALQRSQRDTQRKNDLSRMMTQLTSYASNNRGTVPPTTAFYAAGTGFVLKYLNGVSATQTGGDYTDPTSGVGYKDYTTAALAAAGLAGSLYYSNGTVAAGIATGALCDTDGAITTTVTASGVTVTSRNYALTMKLEGQSVPYCMDNR
jgi:prepilin-type N-terminal cleavage/methylation domain-containing protein